MSKQTLCDKFYNIDNVITIRISMSASDWETLKNAEPHGGRCNHAYTGDRYDWYRTAYVEISGTVFPLAGSHRFMKVGIKKIILWFI